MPYKKSDAPIRLTLPSDPNYWVKWKAFLTYGEMKAVTRGAAKPPQPGVGPTSASEDFDREAITDGLLLAHIQDWNLDDEDGNILPLTIESLAILEDIDVNYLSEQLASRLQRQEDDRKNLPSSTAPSPRAPLTAKGKRP